eukprot:TRINITY_DN109481_c0_g1_i1.p1 TRINITY_DN109481_c0_g1~~TRINITY_DN109481_c0_g1_i1.p1  ORF type:complete len:688 (-),score=160.89 TRINITY_DN109481_c0_g1_i1:32-2047(-)
MASERSKVMLPSEAFGKATAAPQERRSRPALSKLIHVGTDVIAHCEGMWQEAVVVKRPQHKGCISVVTKNGMREHHLQANDIALPLGSKTRHVATPMQPARCRQGNWTLDKALCRYKKAGIDTKVMRETDAELHKKVDEGEAPGVISVVFRRGALAHFDCYGYADLERKVPLRGDTIVKLYSMTKCIISVAAAMCMEDGLIKLDDPVSKYIPAFANLQVKMDGGDLVPAERPVTVLHLLTHTAGLGYGPMLGDDPDGETEERFVPLIGRAGMARSSPQDPNAVTTLEQWCQELAKIPLQNQPGTEWFYSYSHDVAGRVIEVATGQSLDTFLQMRVLGPLGMSDTGFEISHDKWHRTAGMYRRNEVPSPKAAEAEAAAAADAGAQETTDTVQGEEKEPETVYELNRIDSAKAESNEWLAGNASPILSGGGSVDAMTGGLVSTAADYSRFCLMLLRKGELDGVRLLKPETVELLCANHLPRATGKDDVWAFGTPGVGFSLLGSVSVEHPELDEALRPGEYGWGGMAGTAWTNDPKEDFFLLSFSLTAFDLTTEEVLRAGVRSAISAFDKRKENALQSRLAKIARSAKSTRKKQAGKRRAPNQKPRLLHSPKKQGSPMPKRHVSTPSTGTPEKRPENCSRSPSSAGSCSSLASEKRAASFELEEASPKRRLQNS